jgi:hypothetical protein
MWVGGKYPFQVFALLGELPRIQGQKPVGTCGKRKRKRKKRES